MFNERLKGSFDGMFRLEDARALGERLAQHGDWYAVQPENLDQPHTPLTAQAARAHYLTLVEEILAAEKGVWSTMVYVQSQEEPRLIKIYHPKRAGCGCGGSGGILPWWIFSKEQPQPVPQWQQASTKCEMSEHPKRGLIARLFSA
ncbi:hypothetical protein Mmc1_1397 [Magnetococcus marinus MC-1]|uniref:Uncharacterized protein n=1 Tax=Magnetococcus marinus (strain ATCC BAA-1437 / JCM 17883 / MC-1) TaxID=156889 RepID=A0L7G5_MAGMM|nr:hypothetical protein [Magnetococcus marinus]ABK43908.1 hypothetical protein Mmc1_1397 [Magnetococcus marinus MC-1]